MDREIQSFVIRKGKMSRGQKTAYHEYGKKWMIPFQDKELDIHRNFGTKPLVMEIGFGMGDATWQIARDNPDKMFLGVEVHKPGVGKLLAHIEQEKLENLRIIEYNVVKVLGKMLPDNCLEGVHIFFPDPWPKKKHHKRRLIQESFVKRVLDSLLKDGYLYVVTDWEPYAEHIRQVLDNTEGLRTPVNGEIGSLSWRPQTAFERKGLSKNHNIYEFYYIKNG